MDFPIVSIEKPKSLTYLGARAVIEVVHHDKSRTGLRTITTTWIDAALGQPIEWPAGSVTRKTIKGDAWKRPGSFETIISEAIVA